MWMLAKEFLTVTISVESNLSFIWFGQNHKIALDSNGEFIKALTDDWVMTIILLEKVLSLN